MDARTDGPCIGLHKAKDVLPYFCFAKLSLAVNMLQELVKVAGIYTAEALHGLVPRFMASFYVGYFLVFLRECIGGQCRKIALQLRARSPSDAEASSTTQAGAPGSGSPTAEMSSDLIVPSQGIVDNVCTSLVSGSVKASAPLLGEEAQQSPSGRQGSEQQSLTTDISTAAADLCSGSADSNEALVTTSHSELAVCPPARHTGSFEDFDLVDSVQGLQGLKAALAAKFASDPNALPDSFRRGYIVDLDQHWISVHASFDENIRSLSLIVFDTLEVDFQKFHQVGLLRSSAAESAAALPFPREDDGIDVVTLCKMRGITYDIAFLTPISDMRRLTCEEEEDIRTAKRSSKSTSPTIYYDQDGVPFRKIIVQPILQAERDGTCKSRALAVLVWLLRQDDQALRWYVISTRELFEVELRAQRLQGQASGRMQLTCAGECLKAGSDADEAIFGSLMSSGRRDKFGRDVHLKVCHVDTLRHNRQVEERTCAAVAAGGCSLDGSDRLGEEALLPGDSREGFLQHQREAEVRRIREVLGWSGVPRGVDAARLQEGLDDGIEEKTEFASAPQCGSLQHWRAIADHEARWQFLEETCFFGHNLGFRKIKKLYSRDDVLEKETTSVRPMGTFTANEARGLDVPSQDPFQGFGATKYLRKYMVENNYITHEADPMFNQPLENFFGFLCSSNTQERVKVPFYVLPFPGCFVGLSLENYEEGANFELDVDGIGDLDTHRSQRVSDYSLPSGNSFLNNPTSYNRSIANVSLPVKLAV
jgi:hypothetical protein